MAISQLISLIPNEPRRNPFGDDRMSQDTQLARTFLLKVDEAQAQQIDTFRWESRQQSPDAAVRRIFEMGLQAARQADQGKAAAG
jgi:hypothetical protein